MLILSLLWYFVVLNYKRGKHTPQRKLISFLRLKLIYTSLISTQATCFMDIDGNSRHSHTIVSLVNVITVPINKGQKSVVMKSIHIRCSEWKKKSNKKLSPNIYHANILKERIQYNAYYKDIATREQFSKVSTWACYTASNSFPCQNKLNTNSEIEKNVPWSCDTQERHWSYLEC